eukprot:CAMPEP_0184356338 /NCGR_PEP_ID=MMETSP1089-20130417/102158_1 /TAXON_ID=38269 ORGANISM="Gloeochaete wittrockiana, Strain SAG46.84" /NCGR_SAMPLE_ID=MMETSP1089 /ASSEMBLY_ACC=CAM_ASM_000445 /LENGTH=379 /DNA_ID=CAMNT_0026693523 /DNA_START=1 /DNA_END=1140 /DNA_ORIENTATION=+
MQLCAPIRVTVNYASSIRRLSFRVSSVAVRSQRTNDASKAYTGITTQRPLRTAASRAGGQGHHSNRERIINRSTEGEINEAYAQVPHRLCDSQGQDGLDVMDVGSRRGHFKEEELHLNEASETVLETRLLKGSSNVHVELSISLKEAALGARRDVTLDGYTWCRICSGTGLDEEKVVAKCLRCKGSGRSEVRRQGFVGSCTKCLKCGRPCTYIRLPCHACKGEKKVRTRRSIQIDIPVGVDNGTKLTLAGQGDPYGQNGGLKSDLVVNLKVKRDQVFKRLKEDIYVDVPLSLSQAVLGCNVEVPTLTGDITLEVPAGIQPGEQKTLRGKGIKRLQNSGHGNQYVTFTVVIPVNVSPLQTELLREYALLEQQLYAAKPLP